MKVRLAVAVVLIGYAAFVYWFVGAVYAEGQAIEAHHQAMANQKPPYATIIRPEQAKRGLVVPTWRWLDTSGPWQLVSKERPMDVTFTPEDLEEISIPYGDWVLDNRLRIQANQHLAELSEAATEAGYPIIVTSAFRSGEKQQELLDISIAQYGRDWANTFVATPGHSEHQLGLAVDLSSHTPACKARFADCYLQDTTAQWLAEHASNHGFILRYPEDKENITGVPYESWHFRFVGERLAQYLVEEDFVLEEVIPALLEQKP